MLLSLWADNFALFEKLRRFSFTELAILSLVFVWKLMKLFLVVYLSNLTIVLMNDWKYTLQKTVYVSLQWLTTVPLIHARTVPHVPMLSTPTPANVLLVTLAPTANKVHWVYNHISLQHIVPTLGFVLCCQQLMEEMMYAMNCIYSWS